MQMLPLPKGCKSREGSESQAESHCFAERANTCQAYCPPELAPNSVCFSYSLSLNTSHNP